eukprot:364081-Chlamydomonas_euryale.AAC.3
MGQPAVRASWKYLGGAEEAVGGGRPLGRDSLSTAAPQRRFSQPNLSQTNVSRSYNDLALHGQAVKKREVQLTSVAAAL